MLSLKLTRTKRALTVGASTGNSTTRTRQCRPAGVVGVQAAEQRVEQPPIGAVIVHLDLLPDDALLFGDGGLGEPGLAHHT